MKNLFTKFNLVLLLLLLLAMPALAQDDVVVPVELVGADGWQWWATLVGVVVGVVVINVGLSVVVNEQVRRWRDEVPAWMLPYMPTIQSQIYGGFNQGVDYLRQRAKQTPASVDDELVTIVDKLGRKAIVFLFEDEAGNVRVGVKGENAGESLVEDEAASVPF